MIRGWKKARKHRSLQIEVGNCAQTHFSQNISDVSCFSVKVVAYVRKPPCLVSDTSSLSAFYSHMALPSEMLITELLKHKIFVGNLFGGNWHYCLQPQSILTKDCETNPTVSQDNWQYWQEVEILILTKQCFWKTPRLTDECVLNSQHVNYLQSLIFIKYLLVLGKSAVSWFWFFA